MKLTHLQIHNRTGKLKLNDGVYKESADKLIEELESLYGTSAVAAKMVIGEAVCVADDALESVEVEINSPGGSVFEGQRIYNALRGMSERGVAVTTTVNGLAASMGSVILMAGDERRMTSGSRVMIHEASTIAVGDARSLRKTSDLLESISSEIAGIYAERTCGDEKEIRKMMHAETWMTADEAKDAGFVDVILKDGKIKAEFDTEEKVKMSIFARLFPGNEDALKIEATLLEADSLRVELESAQNKITELTSLSEVNAQLQSELSDAQAKIAANDAEIINLKSQVEVSQEKIAIRAAELVAATGHKAPVNITSEDNGAQGKTLTMDAFNALSPFRRMEFVKTDGKLTN